MTMTMSQTKKDDSPCLSSEAAKSPRLKARKIGIVSRDYTYRYPNGFWDFSDVLSRVIKKLDDEKCDTVLFSSISIEDRSSFRPLSYVRHVRHIRSVFYEEFTGRYFSPTEGKWKKGKKAKSRYIVLHRKANEWHEYTFRQMLASLNASKQDRQEAKDAGKTVKEWMQAKIDCLKKDMPRRLSGNCCLILCGESNGVKIHRDDMKVKVRDDFGVRKAIRKEANVILNPIHDRMGPRMNVKREFWSRHHRWVISVWNKGKILRDGKTRDGSGHPWMIFHNGKNKTSDVTSLGNDLNVEIGVLDIQKA
jgi:hypothetical protein